MPMYRMNPGAAPIYVQITEPQYERLEADRDKMRVALAKSLSEPAFPYAGVWREGMECEAGSFITDKGSLWFCRTNTSNRPSEDHDSFQLAVKRGRDGKDARA